jgi:hypothetical protein
MVLMLWKTKVMITNSCCSQNYEIQDIFWSFKLEWSILSLKHTFLTRSSAVYIKNTLKTSTGVCRNPDEKPKHSFTSRSSLQYDIRALAKDCQGSLRHRFHQPITSLGADVGPVTQMIFIQSLFDNCTLWTWSPRAKYHMTNDLFS